MLKTKKTLIAVICAVLVSCFAVLMLSACTKKKELASIEITAQPMQTVYTEGDKFDPTGLVVNAVYSDESKEEITDYTLSIAKDTVLTSANKKVTVSYTYNEVTKTADFSITVKAIETPQEVTLSALEIASQPDKIVYNDGEAFDPTGLVVKAVYSDESKKDVTDYTLSIAKDTVLTTADKKVTVSYTEDEITKTADFNITVNKVLKSIEIETQPTKKEYNDGEKFNSAGMVVKAVYSDGSKETVNNYNLTPAADTVLDTTVTEITVTFGTMTAKVPITVHKVLTGLEITAQPAKTVYEEGEEFDASGMVVSAVFSDGSKDAVTNYTVTPSGNLASTATKVTLTYTYRGVEKTADVAITVNEIEAELASIVIVNQPNKTEYNVGETFDKTGLTVKAVLDNGVELDVQKFTCSPEEPLAYGDKVTVSYTRGEVTKTVEVNITVYRVLASIAVTTQPTKTTYTEDESFDPAGMVVTATYTDGHTEEVTGYVVSDKALAPSDKKLTVSYLYRGVTKTTEVEITVKDWDADFAEDFGEGVEVKDNKFEAEAALYNGKSAGSDNHACTGISYFFDSSLSGYISLRKINAGNTFTFTFTSDKSVKVKMEVAVASYYDGKAWVTTNLNQMLTATINGKPVNCSVQVPEAAAEDVLQGNNYTCIKVATIDLSIKEGVNTLVFTTASKLQNFDYINIKTTANLTGWENHYWVDDVNRLVNLDIAPTTDNEGNFVSATGDLYMLCSGATSTTGHPSKFTLPEITADSKFYTVTSTADDKYYIFSFELIGETVSFKIKKTPEPITKFITKTVKLELIEGVPYMVIVSEFEGGNEEVIEYAEKMFIDYQEFDGSKVDTAIEKAELKEDGLCYSYVNIAKMGIASKAYYFHYYKDSTINDNDKNFKPTTLEETKIVCGYKTYSLAKTAGLDPNWKNGFAGITVTLTENYTYQLTAESVVLENDAEGNVIYVLNGSYTVEGYTLAELQEYVNKATLKLKGNGSVNSNGKYDITEFNLAITYNADGTFTGKADITDFNKYGYYMSQISGLKMVNVLDNTDLKLGGKEDVHYNDISDIKKYTVISSAITSDGKEHWGCLTIRIECNASVTPKFVKLELGTDGTPYLVIVSECTGSEAAVRDYISNSFATSSRELGGGWKTYNMSVSDIKVADGLCYAYINISAYTINEVPYYWNINDNYNGGNYSHIAVSEHAAELSVTTGYKTYTLSSIGELYEGEDSWKNSLAVIKTTYNESLNYQLTPTNVKLEASDDGKKIYYVIEGTYTQTGFTSNELLQAALSELNVLKLTPTTGDIKNFSLSFVINDETTFTAKADITSLGNGSWMSRLNDEDIKLGAKEDAVYSELAAMKEYTVISRASDSDTEYSGTLTLKVLIKKPQAPTANYIDIYTVSKWNNEGSELDNKIAPVLEEDGSLKIQGGADNIGAAKIDCLSVNGNPIHNNTTNNYGKSYIYSMNIKADGNFNIFLFGTNKTNTHTNFSVHRAIRFEFNNGKISIGFNGDGSGKTQADSVKTDYSFAEATRVDFVITRIDAGNARIQLFVGGEAVELTKASTNSWGSLQDNNYSYQFTTAGFGTRLVVSPDKGKAVYLSKPAQV